MSLSLDDVRNKRFRMARKSGYEVLEVDEFVDEVEETFAQLVEENQNLKKQVDALRSAGSQAPAPAQPKGIAPQAAAPQAAAPQAAAPNSTVEKTPAVRVPVPGAVVVTTSKEASTAVVRLVELSTEQAERLVDEATAEAVNIRQEANRSAEQVTADAKTQAERLESEARVRAERLQSDAASRAKKLDRDIESRRSELVGNLEKQRDDLVTTVTALRSFEATYRSNLTTHLRTQITSLESGSEEPPDAPVELKAVTGAPKPVQGGSQSPTQSGGDKAPAQAGGSASDTPRLDALLGDQR